MEESQIEKSLEKLDLEEKGSESEERTLESEENEKGNNLLCETQSTKKNREEKFKKKDDRSVEQVLKALSSLGTSEEKLAAICKKYSDIVEENRKLQVQMKQYKKKFWALQREKEQLQSEQGKTVLTRSRLESLCRELQKQNRQIKEESLQRIKEEEEKRKAVSAKFQSTLGEITLLMQQNTENNSKLRDENLEMQNKFKTICEQYELRGQQVEKMSQQMKLESQLADAKLNKLKIEMVAEKELLENEKKQLIIELTAYQQKCQELQKTEVTLKNQISMYTEKYDKFQGALAKSNELYGGFKAEMGQMSDKITKLEKETSVWKMRWEKNHKTLLQVASEKQQKAAELSLAAKQLAQLQKLCRTLQADRTSLLMQLKSEGITPKLSGDGNTSAENESESREDGKSEQSPPPENDVLENWKDHEESPSTDIEVSYLEEELIEPKESPPESELTEEALSWRGGLCTCVLESDFGFTLNCQFKKSSIFRVRNLGGVKGYVGLGFSVGDELGFGQSLSNLEGNKRRSTDSRSSGLSAFADDENLVNKKSESARMYQGTRSNPYKSSQPSTIPPFKPIPPAEKSTGLKPVAGYVVGPMLAVDLNNTRPVRTPGYTANSIPNFHSLPASISKIQSSMKAPQTFKNALQQATSNFQMQSSVSNNLLTNKLSHRTPVFPMSGPQLINVVQAQPQIDRISANSAPALVKLLPTAIPVSNSVTTEKPKPLDNVGSGLMADTVKTLSQATNISVEAIAAAINQKQQQLLKQQKTQKIVTTTTTTTTTERAGPEPTRKYPLAGPSRVMNAPREYYPVGYEKNFDDNFVSRVELPETSFYCGEQKHFPGLYADEDLGCMVFHVCAFTDDGLIMKSFLCPESTLFDQSILKCNWWFYVDCKSSKKLYDSNIPISKSYQLMKALAFFSSYNKQR